MHWFSGTAALQKVGFCNDTYYEIIKNMLALHGEGKLHCVCLKSEKGLDSKGIIKSNDNHHLDLCTLKGPPPPPRPEKFKY